VYLKTSNSLIQLKGRVDEKSAAEIQHETGYTFDQDLFETEKTSVFSVQ
jgi:hypothetical protein